MELMKYDNSKVRRQDRLLDEERAREILATAEYGVLSMKGVDGKPYGVPVNFVWDVDCVYIHCAPEGKKLEAIDIYDDVSMCIVGKVELLPSEFTTRYESVILTGTATIISDEEEREQAIELLIDKYSPNDKALGMKYAAKSLYRTEFIRIDIETFSGKCKK